MTSAVQETNISTAEKVVGEERKYEQSNKVGD